MIQRPMGNLNEFAGVNARSYAGRTHFPISYLASSTPLTPKQKEKLRRTEKTREQTRDRLRQLAQEWIKRRKQPVQEGACLQEQQPAPVKGSGFIRMRYPAGRDDVDVEVGGDNPDEVARMKKALQWVYPGKRVGDMKRSPRLGEALQEAQDPKIEHLYIFDMDDTLIELPATHKTGRQEFNRLTGKKWPFKRWWTVPQTLQAPFDIKIRPDTKMAFNAAKGDPKGFVAVVTGRIASKEMRKTVESLLKRLGVGPLKYGDNLFLKRINEMNTLVWKKKMLDGFRKRFPNLKEVHLWDDRCDHVEAFEAHIRKMGLIPQTKCVQPLAADTLFARVVMG